MDLEYLGDSKITESYNYWDIPPLYLENSQL